MPPYPPPHDGYYEFWMTPVLFGLLGPLLVIFCLVIAISTCDMYTFQPRPKEIKNLQNKFGLDEFPGANAYMRRYDMAETLRRATDPETAAAETQLSTKRVGWR